jgi:hypothetical protein
VPDGLAPSDLRRERFSQRIAAGLADVKEM